MTGGRVKGWCPGALKPMLSGDGLVVRLRPWLGRLTPDQVRGIAVLALRHGNGLIDLTARGNIQLRGIREEAHPALIEDLDALGLVDTDPVLEARRNLVLTPFWRMGEAIPRLASALETALGTPDAPALPAKFGFAIDCGPAPVLSAISADIRLEQGLGGALLCRADGAETGMIVAEDDAIPAMLDLARWFLGSGGAPEGRGRMKRHLASGASLPPAFLATQARKAASGTPKPGLFDQGALVGFAFGQLRAETLASLAELGPLRMTPWRMMMIEGAATLPEIPGLITRGDDPLLRVIACTGAPGCLQALQPTRDLARMLAPHIPEAGLLHVAGCVKGCAHPAAAPFTLVGTAAGFGFIRDGNAAAFPVVTGLRAEAASLAGLF
ncbi:MAG: precorrin-3B [Beijerinckiaceae bacterium]|nr:MAG: precorrin-3B [Beijerinckiaceae bacterium]